MIEIVLILLFMIISSLVIVKTSVYCFGSYINILSISSLWWYFLLTIAFINPNSYFKLSLISSIIFISTPIVIMLGSIVSSVFLRIKMIRFTSVAAQYTRLHRKDKILSVLMWFTTIIIVFSMYMIAQSLNLDLQSLRDIMYSHNAAETNPLFKYLTPIKWFTKGVFLYLIFKQLYIVLYLNNFRHLQYLLLNIIFYIALNVSGGGRGAALEVATLSIILLLLHQPLGNIGRLLVKYNQYKKVASRLIAALAILLILVTFFRSQEVFVFTKLYNTFIQYFIGPYYAFDQMLLSHPDIELSRYGLTFMGLDTVLVSGILRFMMGLDVASLISQISYQSHFGVAIANGVQMNASYTFLYSTYIEGGVVGVIVFLFLLGVILPILTKNFYNKITINSFFVIIFLHYLMLTSTRISALESPAWMIFLIMPFLSNFLSKKIK